MSDRYSLCRGIGNTRGCGDPQRRPKAPAPTVRHLCVTGDGAHVQCTHRRGERTQRRQPGEQITNTRAAMTRAAAPTRETITTLSPYDLADLLGVNRADAGLLSTTEIRVPTDFISAWKSRLGPLELSVTEITFITGIAGRTLVDWLKAKSLVGRRIGGAGRGYRVSPQSLVEFLRLKNDGPTPVVVETPRQERERGAASQRRAAEILTGRRRK
jgi:hypothetical protein